MAATYANYVQSKVKYVATALTCYSLSFRKFLRSSERYHF